MTSARPADPFAEIDRLVGGAGFVPEEIATRARAGFVDAIDVAIAVEKPGENAVGHLHAWSGHRIEEGSISIDGLFERLTAVGKPTVAIGDRGNEIGFGAIHDEVLSLVPEARFAPAAAGAEPLRSRRPTTYIRPRSLIGAPTGCAPGSPSRPEIARSRSAPKKRSASSTSPPSAAAVTGS